MDICVPYRNVVAVFFTLLVISACQPVQLEHIEPQIDETYISQVTGAAWLEGNLPPPRLDDLSTPSFRSLSDALLWEELAQFEGVALVGLKASGLHRGVFRGRVLISPPELEIAIDALLSVPGVEPYEQAPEDRYIPLMADGRAYPMTTVRITSLEALSVVRRLEFIDYVEPLFFLDTAGCTVVTFHRNPGDGGFTVAAGAALELVPWSYPHLGIPETWGLFFEPGIGIVAPGRGIKIGVVDTGTYPAQAQLQQLFALPLPTNGGRKPAEHFSVRVDPTVRCNHGTRIAGLAAAPADGMFLPNGVPNVIGIAWGADLVTVKIGNGVVQHGGLDDRHGTVPAIVAGLDKAIERGARVITMAFGLPKASDFLRDCIVRIYESNERVILVGAAGTLVGWVVFPATMEREVVSVSIVDLHPMGTIQYRRMTAANYSTDQVAYGHEVDFVGVASVAGVPTLGDPSISDITTVGGSSSATAEIAGIIALVWSRNPSLTRTQVLDRLALSASYTKIEGEQASVGKSKLVGWGIPDAYVAAGGARRAVIDGPLVAGVGMTYRLTAQTDGFGSFTYKWDTGETTPSIVVVAQASGQRTHTVDVTNPVDKTVLRATHTIRFTGSHRRLLYSETLISEWASWGIGKRVNHVVNERQFLPGGCSILGVFGQEYRMRDGVLVPWGVPLGQVKNNSNGFEIHRPGGLSVNALKTVAHVWHDGLSSIRVRVVYDVSEPDGVDCNVAGVTRPTL
jgi:subtilisin family serine protease